MATCSLMLVARTSVERANLSQTIHLHLGAYTYATSDAHLANAYDSIRLGLLILRTLQRFVMIISCPAR